MRKRLVMGAIALVVIGAAAYVLSQRVRTVAYHKRKIDKGLDTTLGRGIRRYAPTAIQTSYKQWAVKRQKFHKKALLELGYLEARTFWVSNRSAGEIAFLVFYTPAVEAAPQTWAYGDVVWSTNSLTIVGAPTEIPQFESAIRTLDVPPEK